MRRPRVSRQSLKVRVRIAPTAHGALYRIESDTVKPSAVLLDRRCKLVRENCLNEKGEFTGNWNPKPYRCYAECVPDDAAGVIRIAVSFQSQELARTYLADELAGRSDLTVKWAKKLAELYPADRCPGDDDSGAMGALYVFLKCGFFPIPVRALYVLHGSAYPRIVMTLPASGKTLEIVSENLSPENTCLKEAYLNGKQVANFVLTHADLMAGGTLRFVWGAAERGTPIVGAVSTFAERR